MTDAEKREKVIRGLECCLGSDSCAKCNFFEYKMDCSWHLKYEALEMLKGSFTPQEVYNTVIEHGQHDKRFKLGDKIDYSFTDVVDILNMELMCKAGDM